MSYLEPPPMPAPVVVVRDLGGSVPDYEAKTAFYRMTGREVRLHECRSACTLALSLPNVCVYPDSILKFHQAYDPRNREPNETVSQQLFNSYPVAVQARLGGLTRSYRVLRGSELIALGIRNCSEPQTQVATRAAPRKLASVRPRSEAQAADRGSIFDGLVQSVMATFGQAASPTAALGSLPSQVRAVGPMPTKVVEETVPQPPARPRDLAARDVPSTGSETSGDGIDRGSAAARAEQIASTPARNVIAGAQAILPAHFAAYSVVR